VSNTHSCLGSVTDANFLLQSAYVKNLGSRNTATRIYRTGDLGCQMLVDDGSFVLHYKGRRDDQIKLRGQRIEPAQIERVLLQQRVPGIIFGGQAAVVCAETDLLIAYVTGRRLEGGDGDNAERIRKDWNAFGNDMDNWIDVGSSPIGADFFNWNSM
jgi:acyl-coenzyme A synthetase/AMP-(fatty) acid ligase